MKESAEDIIKKRQERSENCAKAFARDFIKYCTSGNPDECYEKIFSTLQDAYLAGVKFADTHFPWHKTSEEVPGVKGTSEEGCNYPEVCCLVAGGRMANTPSGIGIRYWNVTEQYWDTEDEDDYDCDKEGYPYWAYADPILEQTPNEE